MPVDEPRRNPDGIGKTRFWPGAFERVNGCQPGEPFSLRAPGGELLAAAAADMAVSVHRAEGGSQLVTKRPGRADHRQTIARDSLVIELAVNRQSPALSALRRAQALGRKCGLQLSIEPERGCWRDERGGKVFQCTSARLSRALSLTTDGKGCEVMLID